MRCRTPVFRGTSAGAIRTTLSTGLPSAITWEVPTCSPAFTGAVIDLGRLYSTVTDFLAAPRFANIAASLPKIGVNVGIEPSATVTVWDAAEPFLATGAIS